MSDSVSRSCTVNDCASINDQAVPAFCLRGRADGPNISMVSGLHGNEWYGVAALLKLWRLTKDLEIRGTLTIVPAANLCALADRSRESYRYPGDMNRQFRINSEPSSDQSREIARSLWNDRLASSDVLVDIHCGGRYDMLYHAVIESNTSLAESPIRYLGVKYAVCWDSYPDGSLVACARESSCLPIGIEFSCGWQLESERTDDLAHRLLQLLKGLNVVPGAPEYTQFPTILSPGKRLCARQLGIFMPHVQVGNTVHKGQCVGEFQMFSEAEPRKVITPNSGLVFSVLTAGPTDRGDSLIEVIAV